MEKLDQQPGMLLLRSINLSLRIFVFILKMCLLSILSALSSNTTVPNNHFLHFHNGTSVLLNSICQVWNSRKSWRVSKSVRGKGILTTSSECGYYILLTSSEERTSEPGGCRCGIIFDRGDYNGYVADWIRNPILILLAIKQGSKSRNDATNRFLFMINNH